jgi:hypothetical protein
MDAHLVDAAGRDVNQVIAEGRDLLLHLLRCAFADGHGADHRSYPDDDAEHGQRRAQLVTREGTQS